MKSEISVVIPTYNRVQFLPSAIKSVLAQTFKEFEILVIDDNRTGELVDQTYQIVKSFGDSRIKYIKNNGKNGVSSARNLGVALSIGTNIAFLDDDDTFSSDLKLQEQLNLLKSDLGLGVVGTNFNIINSEGAIIKSVRRPETHEAICNSINISGGICFGSSMLRKAIFLELGGLDTDISYSEDIDLIYRIVKKYKGYNIQDYMLDYNWHGNNSVQLVNYPSIQSFLVRLKNGSDFPHYFEGLIIAGGKIITPPLLKPMFKKIANTWKQNI